MLFTESDGTYLGAMGEGTDKENIHTVNMLGCHDGILGAGSCRIVAGRQD
ncbi:MAG: hypothetical protein ACLTDV_03165 [Eubacterium sp.]